MSWMARWPGGHPIFAVEAEGARITDADGLGYVDLCLGDTGAMAGHAPAATAEAVADRYAKGATLMLPTEDSIWVAGELARRFGLPQWQLTLSATDANRFAIRLARQITGRRRILVFSYCYHGTVDESFVVVGPDGKPVSREGNVGPPVDPTETTAVVEFNDADALERVLRDEEIACVMTEPALTNIGIVLPEPGFHDALRELTTRDGDAAADRRDPHLQRRARRLHRGARPGARPAHHRQGDRRRRAGRSLRDERRRSRRASPARWTPTTRTPVAWAEPSPATLSRRPRSAPRSTGS